MSKMSKAIAVLGVVAGLGVAALPLSSYAATTSTTTADVQVKVGGAISVSVDNGATGEGVAKNLVDFGEIKLNSAPVAKGLKVTVSTNEAAGTDGQGYSLAMTTTTNNNALVNENNIELPSKAPAQGVSAWGYAVDTDGTALDQTFDQLTGWAAVPALNQTAAVINNAGNIAEGQTTSDNYVYFGVSTSGTQAEGTYKGSVIFTATAK